MTTEQILAMIDAGMTTEQIRLVAGFNDAGDTGTGTEKEPENVTSDEKEPEQGEPEQKDPEQTKDPKPNKTGIDSKLDGMLGEINKTLTQIQQMNLRSNNPESHTDTTEDILARIINPSKKETNQ